MSVENRSAQAGWSVTGWANDTNLSRSFVYELIGAEKIKSVKAGARRIITTPPRDFLASLAEPTGCPDRPVEATGHYYGSKPNLP